MVQSLVRDGRRAGAGVESVLSLVADCVVLSLGRAVRIQRAGGSARRREGRSDGARPRQAGLPGNGFVRWEEMEERETSACKRAGWMGAPQLEGKGSASLSLSRKRPNDPQSAVRHSARWCCCCCCCCAGAASSSPPRGLVPSAQCRRSMRVVLGLKSCAEALQTLVAVFHAHARVYW